MEHLPLIHFPHLEIVNFKQVCESHGRSRWEFLVTAQVSRDGIRIKSRVVTVRDVRHGIVRAYETGEDVRWLQAFEEDLKGGTFQEDPQSGRINRLM